MLVSSYRVLIVPGFKKTIVNWDGYRWTWIQCVFFSPCLALGKKIEAPAQLQELVSDLSSRFVFSPPALRTRRKTTSKTSRAGDELVRSAVYSYAYLNVLCTPYQPCFLNKPLVKAQIFRPKAPDPLVCTSVGLPLGYSMSPMVCSWQLRFRLPIRGKASSFQCRLRRIWMYLSRLEVWGPWTPGVSRTPHTWREPCFRGDYTTWLHITLKIKIALGLRGRQTHILTLILNISWTICYETYTEITWADSWSFRSSV